MPHYEECWRCGAEGMEFVGPPHPDGGGTICQECWQRIYNLDYETTLDYHVREQVRQARENGFED